MASKLGAIRGAGRSVLVEALKNHENVHTSGALRGVKTPDGYSHTGWSSQLAGPDADALKAAEGRIAYVVTSYATPIAWVMRDGTVYRVSQRFSVTTSKHQGFLYHL